MRRLCEWTGSPRDDGIGTEKIEESKTSSTELTFVNALKQFRDQRRGGQENGAVLRALKGFIETVIAEACRNDGIDKSARDKKVVEMVTEKVVSSGKLTRLIAKFVGTEVSKAVKDITVENSKNVGHRPSAQSFGPPSYVSSDHYSIEDSSLERTRRNHTRSKNKR